jgi:hypothetical protein
MKNIQNWEKFNEMFDPMGSCDPKQVDTDENYFHLYRHPCSTSTLYYIIPDKFINRLKSDKNFKIGFYGTDFNDYLSKIYDNERHGSLQGKSYIEYFGKKKLNISPKEHNTYNYKDMYYYEYDNSDIPKEVNAFFINN